jgi:outer membrane protein assembly factor BamB
MKIARRLLTVLTALVLFAFMLGDGKVKASSPDPINGHFQLQSVIVDQPVAAGGTVAAHDLFLVDTDTGRVWRYQPVNITRNSDGTFKGTIPDAFIPVPVPSLR